jgi:hypothetical protein
VQPRTIKALLPSMLKSLDFLHSECQVIHTGNAILSIYCHRTQAYHLK